MGKEIELLSAVKSQNIHVVQKLLNKHLKHKSKFLGSSKNRININYKDKDGMSALHQATVVGNTEIMRLILDACAFVENKDERGWKPLHYAAAHGNVDAVQLLMHWRSAVNEASKKGETALHIASQRGFTEVVSLLLNYHANPTIRDNYHKTPFDLACEHGRYKVAELLLSSEWCSKLLPPLINNNSSSSSSSSSSSAAAKTAHDTSTSSSSTPLHATSSKGAPGKHLPNGLLTSSRAIGSKKESGAGSSRTSTSPTPSPHPSSLHLAARGGHSNIIRLLLEGGANINFRTKQGTCLHEAVLYRRLDVIILLLDYGVNVTVENGYGQTALQLAQNGAESKIGLEIYQLLRDAFCALPAQAVTNYYPSYDPQGLSFQHGDYITVIERRSDGMWKGYVSKEGQSPKTGYFPASAVVLLETSAAASSASLTDANSTSSSASAAMSRPTPSSTTSSSTSPLSNGAIIHTCDELHFSSSTTGGGDGQSRHCSSSSGTPPPPTSSSSSSQQPSSGNTSTSATAALVIDSHNSLDSVSNVSGRSGGSGGSSGGHSTSSRDQELPLTHVNDGAKSGGSTRHTSGGSSSCNGDVLLPGQLLHVRHASSGGGSGSYCSGGSYSTSASSNRNSMESLDSGRGGSAHSAIVPSSATSSTESRKMVSFAVGNNTTMSPPTVIRSESRVLTNPHRHSGHPPGSSILSRDYTKRPRSYASSNGSLSSLDENSSISTLDSVGMTSSLTGSPSVDLNELLRTGVPVAEIVEKWLTSIGFSEYTTKFVDAGYDILTITRVTPEDLTGIGITKPDHRKRLKYFISKLKIDAASFPTFRPSSLLEFLRLVNLIEYEEILTKYQYTINNISHLSWEDMHDLGITKLGHQKKLLVAIDCMRRADNTMKRRAQSMVTVQHGGSTSSFGGGCGPSQAGVGGGSCSSSTSDLIHKQLLVNPRWSTDLTNVSPDFLAPVPGGYTSTTSMGATGGYGGTMAGGGGLMGYSSFPLPPSSDTLRRTVSAQISLSTFHSSSQRGATCGDTVSSTSSSPAKSAVHHSSVSSSAASSSSSSVVPPYKCQSVRDVTVVVPFPHDQQQQSNNHYQPSRYQSYQHQHQAHHQQFNHLSSASSTSSYASFSPSSSATASMYNSNPIMARSVDSAGAARFLDSRSPQPAQQQHQKQESSNSTSVMFGLVGSPRTRQHSHPASRTSTFSRDEDDSPPPSSHRTASGSDSGFGSGTILSDGAVSGNGQKDQLQKIHQHFSSSSVPSSSTSFSSSSSASSVSSTMSTCPSGHSTGLTSSSGLTGPTDGESTPTNERGATPSSELEMDGTAGILSTIPPPQEYTAATTSGGLHPKFPLFPPDFKSISFHSSFSHQHQSPPQQQSQNPSCEFDEADYDNLSPPPRRSVKFSPSRGKRNIPPAPPKRCSSVSSSDRPVGKVPTILLGQGNTFSRSISNEEKSETPTPTEETKEIVQPSHHNETDHRLKNANSKSLLHSTPIVNLSSFAESQAVRLQRLHSNTSSASSNTIPSSTSSSISSGTTSSTSSRNFSHSRTLGRISEVASPPPTSSASSRVSSSRYSSSSTSSMSSNSSASPSMYSSNSSLDTSSTSLPFAQEDIGTIKQKQPPPARPSLFETFAPPVVVNSTPHYQQTITSSTPSPSATSTANKVPNFTSSFVSPSQTQSGATLTTSEGGSTFSGDIYKEIRRKKVNKSIGNLEGVTMTTGTATETKNSNRDSGVEIEGYEAQSGTVRRMKLPGQTAPIPPVRTKRLSSSPKLKTSSQLLNSSSHTSRHSLPVRGECIAEQPEDGDGELLDDLDSMLKGLSQELDALLAVPPPHKSHIHKHH